MSIILGPRLIGKEAAAKAQAAHVDEVGGGAIQLGPKLIAGNAKFAKARIAAAAAVAVAPVVPPAPVKTPRATGNKVPREKVAKTPAPQVAPVAGSYSEQDIEVLLAADPNQWDLVCTAEAERPEGWRPAVAVMILNVASEAKEKPIPAAILAELQATVAKVEAAEAATLQAAVASAPAAEAPTATHEAYDGKLRSERP